MARLKTTVKEAEKLIILGLAVAAKCKNRKTMLEETLNFEHGTFTRV